MTESADVMHIVEFGPTVPVPKGHRWCMACNGSGDDSLEEGCACGVCNGKGCWNAEDIAQYHKSAPEICLQSCGETHTDFSRVLRLGELDE